MPSPALRSCILSLAASAYEWPPPPSPLPPASAVPERTPGDVGLFFEFAENDLCFQVQTMGRLLGPVAQVTCFSPQRRYGNSVLVHLHHMEPSTSEKIIARHRSSAAIFSDELQVSRRRRASLVRAMRATRDTSKGAAPGEPVALTRPLQAFPAAVLAGLLAAAPMTDRVLSDHRFMLVGDGDLPAHVAEMISYYLARAKGLPAAAVRRQIFLVDSKGLVNRDRANELTEMQLLYANQEDSGEHPQRHSSVSEAALSGRAERIQRTQWAVSAVELCGAKQAPWLTACARHVGRLRYMAKGSGPARAQNGSMRPRLLTRLPQSRSLCQPPRPSGQSLS